MVSKNYESETLNPQHPDGNAIAHEASSLSTDNTVQYIEGASSAASNLQVVSGSTSTPLAAADGDDLIEEEWITIVKRILTEQKDNPYLLSRAMTILRADYLKKRYNKEIKLPE